MTEKPTERGLRASLAALYRQLSSKRRKQLGLLLILQVATATMEVVSLGTLLPFVEAMTDTAHLANRPSLQPLLALMGNPQGPALIAWMGALFALGVLLSNAMRLATLWAQNHFSATIGSDLSEKVFETTLHQDYLFHTRNNSAKLVSTITQAVSGTVRFTEQAFALATNLLIVTAVSLALLLYEPGLATGAAVVVGTAYGFVVWVTRRRLRRNSVILGANHVVLLKVLQESLGGVREVLLHRVGNVFLRAYRAADGPYRRAVADSMFTSQSPRFLVESVGVVALIGLCVFKVATSHEEASVAFDQILPMLGALALGANRLLPAAQSSYAALSTMAVNQDSVARALQALERPLDPALLHPSPSPMLMREHLRLEEVWFAYDDAEPSAEPNWVLRGLQIEVPCNRTVALVGTTGSGKSTTTDLILGLITPARGALTVDGKVLDSSNRAAWQASLAHVPQAVFLSDSSFAENIAFGVSRESIDLARVKRAAKLAQIDEFIEEQPNKYDEVVGERGIRLSGGQRQRVGIARALYRMAHTIIFDEATSALDQATEKDVMAAIAGLNRQVTIILIAHRLSTVRNADLIFVIEEGRVVAQGTYDELINNSEAFRRMAT